MTPYSIPVTTSHTDVLFIILWTVVIIATLLIGLCAVIIIREKPARIDADSVKQAAEKIDRASRRARNAADRFPKDYHGPRNWFDSLFREYWQYTVTSQEFTTTCLNCKSKNRLRSAELNGVRCGKCHRLFLEPRSSQSN